MLAWTTLQGLHSLHSPSKEPQPEPPSASTVWVILAVVLFELAMIGEPTIESKGDIEMQWNLDNNRYPEHNQHVSCDSFSRSKIVISHVPGHGQGKHLVANDNPFTMHT